MAARLRIADLIAGALDRSLLRECSIGSGTRERGSCGERTDRGDLGDPAPGAWKRRDLACGRLQINSGGIQAVAGDGRGAGGCDGASRCAIPSNPSKIARGERTSSAARPSHAGTHRTLRPERRHATGSDQRTRDETPQSAESPGPGRLERSRRTLTSALSSWISAVSSACSA